MNENGRKPADLICMICVIVGCGLLERNAEAVGQERGGMRIQNRPCWRSCSRALRSRSLPLLFIMAAVIAVFALSASEQPGYAFSGDGCVYPTSFKRWSMQTGRAAGLPKIDGKWTLDVHIHKDLIEDFRVALSQNSDSENPGGLVIGPGPDDGVRYKQFSEINSEINEEKQKLIIKIAIRDAVAELNDVFDANRTKLRLRIVWDGKTYENYAVNGRLLMTSKATLTEEDEGDIDLFARFDREGGALADERDLGVTLNVTSTDRALAGTGPQRVGIGSTNGNNYVKQVRIYRADIYLNLLKRWFIGIPVNPLSLGTLGDDINEVEEAPDDLAPPPPSRRDDAEGDFFSLKGTIMHELMHALGVDHPDALPSNIGRWQDGNGGVRESAPETCFFTLDQESENSSDSEVANLDTLDPCSLTQHWEDPDNRRLRVLDKNSNLREQSIQASLARAKAAPNVADRIRIVGTEENPATDAQLVRSHADDQLALRVLYPPNCSESSRSTRLHTESPPPQERAEPPDPFANDMRLDTIINGEDEVTRHDRPVILPGEQFKIPNEFEVFSNCGSIQVQVEVPSPEEIEDVVADGRIEATIRFANEDGDFSDSVSCDLFGSDARVVITNPDSGPPNAEYAWPGALFLSINVAFCLPGEGLLRQENGHRDCEDDEIELSISSGGEDANFILDTVNGSLFVSGLTLPETSIGETGISLGAENVTLDMSDLANPSGDIADILGKDDIDDGWKGIFIAEADLVLDGGLFNDTDDSSESTDHGIEVIGITIGFGGDVSVDEVNYQNSTPMRSTRLHVLDEDGCIVGRGLEFTIGDAGEDGEFCGQLNELKLNIKRDAFEEFSLVAAVKVPFVDDPLDVSFNVDAAGNVHAEAVSSPEGASISIPEDAEDAAHVKLSLTQLGFGVRVDGGSQVAFLSANGNISVEGIGDLDALACGGGDERSECSAAVGFEGFEVDSTGKVTMPGGWVDLSEIKAIDFAGQFNFNIRKFGFGPLPGASIADGEFFDNGWIGFGGSFQLGEDFSAGVKLNEIRLNWWSGEQKASCTITFGESNLCLSIPAVGVSFDYANSVKVEGEVVYKKSEDSRCFGGRLSASFASLGVSATATMLFGNNESEKFWFFDVAAQLPSGIPIAPDISIYGLAGGLGKNVTFDRGMSESERVKFPDEASDGEGDRNLADGLDGCSIAGWSGPSDVSGFTVTFGLTLGTTHDNGFTANIDARLIISPGPKISILGKAWILTSRSGRSMPPTLSADITFDKPNKLFRIQIEGGYKVEEAGITIVDIGGSFDLLFSPPEWHVFIGEKPKDKRVRAAALSLFRTDTYFNIGNRLEFEGVKERRKGIKFGMSTGYDAGFDAKIVKVYVSAWISGDFAASFSPRQLWIEFGIGGNVGFKIFGIGLHLGMEALATGQFSNPRIITAHFEVEVKLPWPLPDPKISFDMAWHSPPKEGPEIGSPLARDEDAVSLVATRSNEEHSSGIPLRRLPSPLPEDDPETDKDESSAYFENQEEVGPVVEDVPLNSRLVIKFTRPISGSADEIRDDQLDSVHIGDVRIGDFPIKDLTHPAQFNEKIGVYDVKSWLTDLDWAVLKTDEPPSSCRNDEVFRVEFGDPVDHSLFWGATIPLSIGKEDPTNLVYDSNGQLKSDAAELFSTDPEAHFFADLIEARNPDAMSDPPTNENLAIAELVLQHRRSFLTTFPAEHPEDTVDRVGIPSEFCPDPGSDCVSKLEIEGINREAGSSFRPLFMKPDHYYFVRFTLVWRAITTRDEDKPVAKPVPEWTDVPFDAPPDDTVYGAKDYYYCFGTERKPDNLSPNVAWAHPSDGARHAYLNQRYEVDDGTVFPVFVLLNAKQLAQRSGLDDLHLRLFDQTGRVVARADNPETNDGLVYSVKDKLERQTKYTAQLRDGRRVLHEWSFTTSSFTSFGEVMADDHVTVGVGCGEESCRVSTSSGAAADTSGELNRSNLPVTLPPFAHYIAVKTEEPLPWDELDRLNVELLKPIGGGIAFDSIGDLTRVSSVDETIHVFKLARTLETGTPYQLRLTYHPGVIDSRLSDPLLGRGRSIDKIIGDPIVKEIRFEVVR